MKSNAIIRIVIWSIVLVLLAGIFAGLMIEEQYMNDYIPTETVIPVPLETEYVVVPVQPLPNEEELTFPADISEIEIEWVTGDIIIMAKDVDEIRIAESDVSSDSHSLLWQLRGNKLEIQFCEEGLLPGFGFGATGIPSKDLYIDVPMDWKGSSIEIDTASANVEMHNITLQEMDLDGADGTCDFQNCHISDLDIDTADGDIYYAGTLDALDFDAASACFTGDLQNTPSRIDMDSMDGTLDLALPEDCGFTLTMDGMSKHLSSGFEGTSMKNGSHVYGDGRCRINVDGMDCDVTIRKLETVTAEPQTNRVS